MTMKNVLLVVWAFVFSMHLVGCSESYQLPDTTPQVDASMEEVDAAPDSGMDDTDSGLDSDAGEPDAGVLAVDSGVDSGFDASDSGQDAQVTTLDAGTDAGYDAGFDSGTLDAGHDAGTDAGPVYSTRHRCGYNDDDQLGWFYTNDEGVEQFCSAGCSVSMPVVCEVHVTDAGLDETGWYAAVGCDGRGRFINPAPDCN